MKRLLPICALLACARAPAIPLGTDDVPGLIEVEFRGGVPMPQGWEELDRATVEDDEYGNPLRPEYDELVRVSPSDEAATLTKLRARADVIWAEPVSEVHALFVPDDPGFARQWHLKMAGADKAWDATRGEGVTVAVIDTGIAQGDDLDAARMVPGWNFVSRSADARDDNGHGTHVAGTIAQSTDNARGVAGMAPLAKLMPVKVLSAGGGGTSHDIAMGIRWAVDHGARVLNLSLGGGGRSLAMETAVDYARRRGAIVVCAAGNSGARGVSYPAAYDNAFAVSAVGPQGKPAPYTSYGPQVKLAGPGGDKSQGEESGVLQQTLDEDGNGFAYRWFQGTSMATPHVAGAAALLMSLGISAPGAVERLLESTARAPAQLEAGDQPAASSAELYGAGILDAAAAVRKATLQFGLWRLGLALLGAWFALRHARALQQLRKSEKTGPLFWASLALGAGALAIAAPLGFYEKLPALSLLSLAPAAWPARYLGGWTSWLGFSALAPLLLSLPARLHKNPLQSVPGAIAAGLAFGQAGVLLHAAIFRTLALPFLPAMLVPLWLGLNAVVAWTLGRGLLAREQL